MDDRTRAATYEDVRRIVSLLEAEGVEYALVGAEQIRKVLGLA